MQTPSSTPSVSSPPPRAAAAADPDPDPAPIAGFSDLPAWLRDEVSAATAHPWVAAEMRRLVLYGAPHEAHLQAMAAAVAQLAVAAAAAEHAGVAAVYRRRLLQLRQILALHEAEAQRSQTRRWRAQQLLRELRVVDEEERAGQQTMAEARNAFNSLAAAPWENN